MLQRTEIIEMFKLDKEALMEKLASMNDEDKQQVLEFIVQEQKSRTELSKLKTRSNKILDKNFDPNLNRAQRRKGAKLYRVYKKKQERNVIHGLAE